MSEYPAVINMSMISGATRVLSLTWKEANEPINLTNWTARLQIRSKTTSPAVALELTSPNGIVLDADGGIYIEFTPDHTKQLDPGSYRYDLRMADNDDTVIYLVEGAIRVKDPVTRVTV